METLSKPAGSLDDAITRLEAGEVQEALALLQTLVRQAPSDGHVHSLIGICHAQQGNLEQAIKALETAALLNPGDAMVEFNLANALVQAGRTDQARWRLQRILEADPEHEDAKLLLAHLQPPARPRPAPAAPASAGPPGASPQRLNGPAASAKPLATPAPVVTDAPAIGQRLLRGLGWGLLYGQTWTVFSLVAAVIISLFTKRVEHAIIAFLLMAVLTVLFHSAMGVLTGVVVAVLNADEDAGAWIGMSVGLFILLVGLLGGFLNFCGVVFYIFMGRWVGRSVAARVQGYAVAG